jgi:hypothetical protein
MDEMMVHFRTLATSGTPVKVTSTNQVTPMPVYAEIPVTNQVTPVKPPLHPVYDATIAPSPGRLADSVPADLLSDHDHSTCLVELVDCYFAPQDELGCFSTPHDELYCLVEHNKLWWILGDHMVNWLVRPVDRDKLVTQDQQASVVACYALADASNYETQIPDKAVLTKTKHMSPPSDRLDQLCLRSFDILIERDKTLNASWINLALCPDEVKSMHYSSPLASYFLQYQRLSLVHHHIAIANKHAFQAMATVLTTLSDSVNAFMDVPMDRPSCSISPSLAPVFQR